MYRNTAIIADAPATFDDLVAAAQAATTDDVVGANLEYGFFFSAAHLHGVGGLLMDEKGVEWLNLLNSFKDAGPTEYYTDNDVNLFKAGQAGIIIDGTWNTTGLAEAIGAENLAIDPWPTPLSGYVQTENIYLNANAEGEDVDVGWAFMEFFLSAEAQAMLTEAGHIPAVFGDVTRTGAFEPLRTAPAHQRRGLGKAVMFEGLRRLRRLEATPATVSSYKTAAHALYASAGLTEYDLSEPWTEEL
jgi:maltose-binding protein MalE